jgi:phage shock protein C
MVSGVCGGLAEYYEVDVNLIRLAWVVLTILSGVIPGVLAYVAAALLIPKEQLE